MAPIPSDDTPAVSSLTGVRIVDLSRVLAGPLATMVLGDLGADVIKIERPGSGDDTRDWRPPDVDGDSTYFLGLNRNKRSIVLDLDDERDLQIARGLCCDADVVIDNFRPGLMTSFGLDHATLARESPRLVTCSITAFGSEGAAATLPGYDLLLQAMTGLMSLTGASAGPPMKVGAALIDKVAGLYAAVGILAALRHRDLAGEGQHVEVSLFGAGLAGLLNQASSLVTGGVTPQRMGNRHPSIAPYQDFTASDGSFVLAVGNERQWRRLCEVIGRPELSEDPRFADNTSRVAAIGELETELAASFITDTVTSWVTRLRAGRIPAGPVHDVAEALRFAGEHGLEATWSDDVGRTHVRSPLTMSATPPRLHRRPPDLDEHGADLRAASDRGRGPERTERCEDHDDEADTGP
jgi:crotonobetainyl-CoA:carnitine CoA-transferase CaiB-like acyl-CoA transferase